MTHRCITMDIPESFYPRLSSPQTGETYGHRPTMTALALAAIAGRNSGATCGRNPQMEHYIEMTEPQKATMINPIAGMDHLHIKLTRTSFKECVENLKAMDGADYSDWIYARTRTRGSDAFNGACRSWHCDA